MIFFAVLCIILALIMLFLSFCNFYSFKSYKDKPETYSAMLRNGIIFLLIGLIGIGGAIYIFHTKKELDEYAYSKYNKNDYSSYDKYDYNKDGEVKGKEWEDGFKDTYDYLKKKNGY